MTISEPTSRHSTRGKPFGLWEIKATLSNRIEDTLTTTNKRDARRRYEMIVKYSAEPDGKYSGCSVTLTCDGEAVAEYKAIK